MKEMPVADAHIHFFADGYPGTYGALFPGGGELAIYQAIRSVHQIERALVVGYEGEPWAEGNNSYIAELARKHSWMTPLAYCPASRPLTVRQCEQWWNEGFFGLSLYLANAEEAAAVLAWPDEVMSALNDRQALVSVNVPAIHCKILRPFCERLPEARILFSHLGLPEPILEKPYPILQYAQLPHVGVKLSAFYACSGYPHTILAPLMEALYGHFGPRRLYWG